MILLQVKTDAVDRLNELANDAVKYTIIFAVVVIILIVILHFLSRYIKGKF